MHSTEEPMTFAAGNNSYRAIYRASNDNQRSWGIWLGEQLVGHVTIHSDPDRAVGRLVVQMHDDGARFVVADEAIDNPRSTRSEEAVLRQSCLHLDIAMKFSRIGSTGPKSDLVLAGQTVEAWEQYAAAVDALQPIDPSTGGPLSPRRAYHCLLLVKGMNHSEAGAAAGINQGTVSRYVRDEASCAVTTIHNLWVRFGQSVAAASALEGIRETSVQSRLDR